MIDAAELIVAINRFVADASLGDDGYVRPATAAKAKALAQDGRWDRVVPDGDGGFSFERHEAESVFESLNIYADGTAELIRFENCKLVNRRDV